MAVCVETVDGIDVITTVVWFAWAVWTDWGGGEGRWGCCSRSAFESLSSAMPVREQ